MSGRIITLTGSKRPRGDETNTGSIKHSPAESDGQQVPIEHGLLSLTADEWERIHTGYQDIVKLRKGTPEVQDYFSFLRPLF